MRNRLRPLHRSALGALAAALALVGMAVLPACGDDDEDEATTTTEATETTDTTDGASQDTGDSSSGDAAAASEEFCNALADFQGAQDGAQRNTALAEMRDALGDAGSELQDAIDQLETGDLDPSDYAEAAQALEDFGAGC